MKKNTCYRVMLVTHDSMLVITHSAEMAISLACAEFAKGNSAKGLPAITNPKILKVERIFMSDDEENDFFAALRIES